MRRRSAYLHYYKVLHSYSSPVSQAGECEEIYRMEGKVSGQ
jgi:hypothetical protein